MKKKNLSFLILTISMCMVGFNNANAALRDVYLDNGKTGICNKTIYSGNWDMHIFSSSNSDTFIVTVKIEEITALNGRQSYNRNYTVPPKAQVFIGCMQDRVVSRYTYEIIDYKKVI